VKALSCQLELFKLFQCVLITSILVIWRQSAFVIITEVKSKVRELYKYWKRLILKSKLSGCNQITAINSFAVPLIRYTAGVINWTINECAELDRMTQKQLDMYKILAPTS